MPNSHCYTHLNDQQVTRWSWTHVFAWNTLILLYIYSIMIIFMVHLMSWLKALNVTVNVKSNCLCKNTDLPLLFMWYVHICLYTSRPYIYTKRYKIKVHETTCLMGCACRMGELHRAGRMVWSTWKYSDCIRYQSIALILKNTVSKFQKSRCQSSTNGHLLHCVPVLACHSWLSVLFEVFDYCSRLEWQLLLQRGISSLLCRKKWRQRIIVYLFLLCV